MDSRDRLRQVTVLALAEVAEHHDDVRTLGPQVGNHLPGYVLHIGQDGQLVRLPRHGEKPEHHH